jgi:SsrA-binding protein
MGAIRGGKDHIKIIAENRKARHDYFIEEEFEAGMVLMGTEVKSLRQGRANLKDSYGRIRKGEVYVHQMHISPYPFAYYDNHEPLRIRKLLLHKT